MVAEKIFDSCREYIASFEKHAELEVLGITDGDTQQSLQEFKCKIMDLLMSLIEGEVDLEIMQRMSISLDMEVLKERMLKVFVQFAEEVLDIEVATPKEVLEISLVMI